MSVAKFTGIVLALSTLPALATEWRGSITSRYGQDLNSGSGQLFIQQLDLEASFDLGHGWRLFAETQLSYDSKDLLEPGQSPQAGVSNISRRKFVGDRTALELREFFVDGYAGDLFFRIGKQQVVWGQADGLRVLDVINPQYYHEFIWLDQEERRLPLWTVNVEIPIDTWLAQVLLIPDQSYNQIPAPGQNALFEFTSPYLVPDTPDGIPVAINEVDKPDRYWRDADWGLRLSNFIGGWDFSVNYLYHYRDNPVLQQRVDNGAIAIDPRYQRSHLLGGSISNAFGPITLRGELAYSTDLYFPIENVDISDVTNTEANLQSDEFSSVLGIDYNGFSDTLLSAQLFTSVLADNYSELVRDRVATQLSLLWRRDLLNTTLHLEALGIYSVNDGDGSLQLQLEYQLRSRFLVSAGVDIAAGNNDGIFGQFDRRDRVLLGFEWSF